MNTLNINCTGCSNILKTTCWILSVLSWLLFVIVGWISLKWLDDDRILITFIRPLKKDNLSYMPIQITSTMLFILIIITMIIATIAFIVYMIFSTCKKEGGFFEKMFDKITMWHWIPIVLQAGLFLIGICHDGKHWRDELIAGIILVILTLILLGLMYYKTDIGGEIPGILVKKGTYSALIAIDWYYFCYVICQLYMDDHPLKMKDHKNLGISFDIIMGIVMILVVYFFKDVLIAIYYFLIYLGILIFHYKIEKNVRKMYDITVADVIISIIFMIVFLVLIVFLIIKNKKEVLS
jgi:hypothetical protein